VVKGVGWGEGETAVESGEDDVTLEMEGREPDFEVYCRDGATGDEKETGEGGIEGGLKGVEVFGVSEGDQVGEGVDRNGRVPETVEEEDGLLTEADIVKSSLLEGGVSEFDGLDDFVTVGLEGEVLVEDGDKIGEFGDLGDGEWS